MGNATVSVVIPTHNAAQFLEECIRSVLSQTHPPRQIIVCDDASTDGTQEIIKSYEARYPDLFDVILHKKKSGISANFNSGFQRATQKYVSLIAGDDVWRPDKLRAEILALSRDSSAKWAYSDSFLIDEQSRYLQPFRREFDGRDGDILVEVLTHKMSLRNWLAARSLVHEVGLFDERFNIFEDWDMKIRLAQAARVKHVQEENVAYRRHGSGASASDAKIFLENLSHIYRKHRRVVNSLSSTERRLIIESAVEELQSVLARLHSDAGIRSTLLIHLRYRSQLLLMKMSNKLWSLP